MKDSEILTFFDGRGRAEFLLGGFEGRHSDKITAIGHELGYRLQATEMPSRGTIRLAFVRDDSPIARRRAFQAQERLRSGGSLLRAWAAPAEHPGVIRAVTDVEMASTRRKLAAYEENPHGGRALAVILILAGLGFLALAWVLRDRPGAAVTMLVLGVSLAVVAALTPRWMRRWYGKNRRLMDLHDQQRAGQVGPPPPPPALGPPHDWRPGSGSGH
ncbi:hypothetical protein ACFTXB_16465 [Streptomyces sp. NPDC057074]|uniref:hypothetical protein n=1 Tax=Streptomyces sp. NPDC057074 TaxID=3346015 RepID=UPI003638EE47